MFDATAGSKMRALQLSGRTMHVGSAQVVYVLPTLDGHWASSMMCEKVYYPCPTSCLGACASPDEPPPLNAQCVLQLYELQACPWQLMPSLLGKHVMVLAPGGLEFEAFPAPCSR